MIIILCIILLGGCGANHPAGKDTDTSHSPNADTTATTTSDVNPATNADTNTSAGTETLGHLDSDTPSDPTREQKQPKDTQRQKWSGNSRIIAIGDNHADLFHTQRALQVARVIDENLVWTGKDTVVVQTGDVIDRGVEEREVIDFYEQLRPQAAAQGGRIVNMNGNHEIMTAMGDYRYMKTDACAAFSDLTELDISNAAFAGLTDDCKKRAAAFWPGGPYAKIISDWPVVTIVEDSVFVHGGLHSKHLEYGIDNINRMTEKWLLKEGDLDTEIVGGGTAIYAVDWDRTFSDTGVTPSKEICDNLKTLLDQLGVSRMVVGHTVQRHISSACDKLVYRIDTGMSDFYGGPVEVLEIIDGQVTVLTDPQTEHSVNEK